MPYRNPTPEKRTLINGIWSDLMDIVRSSFLDNGGTDTALKVTTTNKQDIEESLANAIRDSQAVNEALLKEIKLLNIRFEETFNTRINHGDL